MRRFIITSEHVMHGDRWRHMYMRTSSLVAHPNHHTHTIYIYRHTRAAISLCDDSVLRKNRRRDKLYFLLMDAYRSLVLQYVANNLYTCFRQYFWWPVLVVVIVDSWSMPTPPWSSSSEQVRRRRERRHGRRALEVPAHGRTVLISTSGYR